MQNLWWWQVTRSIGDDDLKPFVTAEPELQECVLSANDEFLVGEINWSTTPHCSSFTSLPSQKTINFAGGGWGFPLSELGFYTSREFLRLLEGLFILTPPLCCCCLSTVGEYKCSSSHCSSSLLLVKANLFCVMQAGDSVWWTLGEAHKQWCGGIGERYSERTKHGVQKTSNWVSWTWQSW